ncbi:MAG: hypothetical protein WDW38_005512 [Sanguina aurantia]
MQQEAWTFWAGKKVMQAGPGVLTCMILTRSGPGVSSPKLLCHLQASDVRSRFLFAQPSPDVRRALRNAELELTSWLCSRCGFGGGGGGALLSCRRGYVLC